VSAVDTQDRTDVAAADRRYRGLIASDLSSGAVLVWLIVLAAASTALRAAMSTRVQTGIVFPDELGYTKLAQSIGLNGRFGLFDEPGMSFSPLYPILLSPIYALGASAPTAYALIKLVNALLISLAVFPTYKIARFVLPRRSALIVAAISAVAPLMTYASLTVSESLAYPLCLLALWALLETTQKPTVRGDALFLAAAGLATAARIQLIVLVPAGITAVLLRALLIRVPGIGLIRAIADSVREHVLLFGVVVGSLLVVGVADLAGVNVSASLGRYSIVVRASQPSTWHFLDILARHVAGLALAVGVAPFVAALVAAYAFARDRTPRAATLAAVASSAVAWLLIEVAYNAALFDSEQGDLPRIHERFLIYVVPFFLVALIAVVGKDVRVRVYAAAAACTALLPLLIPYGTVVNYTIGYETFALHPFSQLKNGITSPLTHATLAAVWAAATLALLYVFVRRRLRAVVVLVLLPFVFVTMFAQGRIQATSADRRALLPGRVDWVDRAASGDVVLITTNRDGAAELQTAYTNVSIDRLYAVCRSAFAPEFGEDGATIDANGVLRDESGRPIAADYVVSPNNLLVRGGVAARNEPGREVTVAPVGRRVTVPPQRADSLDCSIVTRS
jgi:hypothetical protein